MVPATPVDSAASVPAVSAPAASPPSASVPVVPAVPVLAVPVSMAAAVPVPPDSALTASMWAELVLAVSVSAVDWCR
jgi:hypothetical protein